MARSKVAILMAVNEDVRFLPQQLSSIREQDHEEFEVWVSRDCTGEPMSRVLADQARRFGKDRFFVLAGPNRGCAQNFLSMIFNTDIRADYFAYSDQDDIWEPDKLSRAISELEIVPPTIPALYGSRTCLIDRGGHNLGFFPFHGREPSFSNALVQNIASGHTMVMNRAAREVMLSSGIRNGVWHDWWTYLIISGSGGRVFYDLRPTVHYRQHDRNLTGAPPAYGRGFIRRARRIIGGHVRTANAMNLVALRKAESLLTPENRRILDTYCRALDRGPFARLWELRNSGVYRQTRIGNAGLLTAALLKKL